MNYLELQDWTFPIPIAYGPGRLKEISQFCIAVGMKSPLIVTDKGSRHLPFIDEVQHYLSQANLNCAVYSNISPNPRDDEILEGKVYFKDAGHDGVVAIGGGSAMDGGKAISLVANNDVDLWAFEYEQDQPELNASTAFAPLITIPTTAGTGAETESTAMITDTTKKMKWCIWHAKHKPAFTILDPSLTLNLPANLTAWTGVDALVHAIEAYCVPGFNPLCDGLALEAMTLINACLPVAFSEPNNLEARGGMLAGSCLAGVAFLKGLGAVHALSHMIGAEFDTQHGLTNAIILPAVLRHNAVSISEKIAPMSHAMGLQDTSFDTFYSHICNLLDTVGIPKTLLDIGVPENCVNRIAKKAMQDSAAATNPCVLTELDLRNILAGSLTIGR